MKIATLISAKTFQDSSRFFISWKKIGQNGKNYFEGGADWCSGWPVGFIFEWKKWDEDMKKDHIENRIPKRWYIGGTEVLNLFKLYGILNR